MDWFAGFLSMHRLSLREDNTHVLKKGNNNLRKAMMSTARCRRRSRWKARGVPETLDRSLRSDSIKVRDGAGFR